MPYNIPGGAFDVTVTMVYYLILNLHAAMIHLHMYTHTQQYQTVVLSHTLHPVLFITDPPSHTQLMQLV